MPRRARDASGDAPPVALLPLFDCAADDQVRRQEKVYDRCIGQRRRALALEPSGDLGPLVRVAIGSNNRVLHDVLQRERGVSGLLYKCRALSAT